MTRQREGGGDPDRGTKVARREVRQTPCRMALVQWRGARQIATLKPARFAIPGRLWIAVRYYFGMSIRFGLRMRVLRWRVWPRMRRGRMPRAGVEFDATAVMVVVLDVRP